ncbi:MAG: PilZ domain-containing protein [Nitrospiraceae bacterium]|nr:MAG: PilZ domain-containing protein [Nitrospiraceae bacterium]
MSRRIPVRMEAYVISGEKTYTGSIKNISELGFEFFIPYALKEHDLHLEKTVEIYFQAHTGDVINMLCAVKWISGGSLSWSETVLGMQIGAPPDRFREFLSTFDIVTVN